MNAFFYCSLSNILTVSFDSETDYPAPRCLNYVSETDSRERYTLGNLYTINMKPN